MTRTAKLTALVVAVPLVFLGLLSGCTGAGWWARTFGSAEPTDPKGDGGFWSDLLGSGDSGAAALWPLQFVSVVALLAGVGALFLTRGSKGWWAIIGGVSLVVVNYAIRVYFHGLFVTAAIVTGLFAIVVAWKSLRGASGEHGVVKGFWRRLTGQIWTTLDPLVDIFDGPDAAPLVGGSGVGGVPGSVAGPGSATAAVTGGGT